MPDSRETLDAMAEEIFELYRVIAIVRSRLPSGPDDLSETEFLTLDTLSKQESLTVGEIQKRVGVVAAQMSRIVRSLEEQSGGYVACQINAEDRRRIDVRMTEAGRIAHGRYRQTRLGSMVDILSVLPPNDRIHFMRILRTIRTEFQKKLNRPDGGKPTRWEDQGST